MLVPIAVGSLVDIATAHLRAELTATVDWRNELGHTLAVSVGLALLFAVAIAV